MSTVDPPYTYICVMYLFTNKQLKYYLYTPFIVMHKQLNLVPILYLCLVLMGLRGGCGVGTAGCLWIIGGCSMLWRLDSFGAVDFGNSAERGAREFP